MQIVIAFVQKDDQNPLWCRFSWLFGHFQLIVLRLPERYMAWTGTDFPNLTYTLTPLMKGTGWIVGLVTPVENSHSLRCSRLLVVLGTLLQVQS